MLNRKIELLLSEEPGLRRSRFSTLRQRRKDKEKNNCSGKEVEITGEGSKVRVFVIPTNEELMIAKDTQALVENM